MKTHTTKTIGNTTICMEMTATNWVVKASVYKPKAKYCQHERTFLNRYATEAEAKVVFENMIANEIALQAKAAERKAAKMQANKAVNAADFYQVGDIVVNTWGWEQTNNDFYKVTKLTAKTIEVTPVYVKVIEGSVYEHGMACEVEPSDEIKPNGKTYKLLVRSEGRLSNPQTYYHFRKWNGQALYESWYA